MISEVGGESATYGRVLGPSKKKLIIIISQKIDLISQEIDLISQEIEITISRN